MAEDGRSPIAIRLDGFREHLQTTCGVCRGTVHCYTTHVKEFLEWKSECDTDPSKICPADLIAFVSEYALKHKPKTSKVAACALRSFLRFMQLEGHCPTHLVDAVPTVPAWKLSSLPTYLSPGQVDLLLGGFDRTTDAGRRGYAIAQCMLLLGLRAGEVAQLSLDDIDWRTGTVGIPKTKPRRVDKLPLPTAVGRAIVEYLRDGRPPTPARRIFVSLGPPYGKAVSSSAVSQVIRRAISRSEIGVASKGSHILRHTAAARMVQAGASLKQVSDVLRHRHLDTTMIYAKVDLPSLREVAMRWPEVTP